MKRNPLFLALCLMISISFIGQSQISIHQKQLEHYDALGKDYAYYQQNNATNPNRKTVVAPRANCNLNKIVFGWHPYWSNGLESNYQWNLLSDLCYFAYEVNPSTGNPNSTHGFSSANVIDEALSHNVRVSLCVTLFSNHSTFFGSSSAEQTLITNLINMCQSRGITGVNLDFEGMSASNKNPFTNFVTSLSTQFKAAIPNGQISIALYAVDWSNVFDISALVPHVDLFCIMGYDYYYGGSATAGPTDPLFHFGSSYNQTLSKSVTDYLDRGIPKNKLVLGLPYYGKYWPVSSYSIPASTTGSGSSIFYNDLKDNTSGHFNASNRHVDHASKSVYYNYSSGGTKHQCFITEGPQMEKRLDFIRKRGLAGMGIWALGYDDGYSDFWNAISDKLTDCYQDPCSGTISDVGGGDLTDYYNNENYSYTIAPPGATSITVNFQGFNVEQDYDYLYVYDGTSTGAPQVPGSPFTGNSIPASFTSSSGAITVKFTSDGATTAPGFNATYTCHTDNVAPITLVDSIPDWKTTDFTAHFSDSDEVGGSGLQKAFYQVLEFNGSFWQANEDNGFFSDNFDSTAIRPIWTVENGTWNVNANQYLEQSDESDGNTNIHAPLTQDLSNEYLYTWSGKISGSGNNRRAGLHFFCDDPTQSNRGNSYFVYFRTDVSNNNNGVQIYKVNNNTWTLEDNQSFVVNADEWYNFAVRYNRITGKIVVYVNNVVVAKWTDPNPLADGNSISFRSGNCDYQVNNFKVYRSRYPSTTISVGPADTNDIRYQNPNPSTPSGKVKSVVVDEAENLSTVAYQFVNVDWTPPQNLLVNDGAGADIDTTYSSILEANWGTITDPNSGIAGYKVAIGTATGLADVLPWTTNGINSAFSHVLANPVYNQLYYISVKAKNGAGLMDTVSSDGQRYVKNLGVNDNEWSKITIFPNPSDKIIKFQHLQKSTDILIYDTGGKLVLKQIVSPQKNTIDISRLAQGTYSVMLKVGHQFMVKKIVKR